MKRKKMILTLIWGAAVVYMNRLAAKFATKRAALISDHPLPDVLHDALPQIHPHAPDFLLLLCFLRVLIFRLHVPYAEVFRLLSSLSLRPIFICMTSFPTCFEKEEKKDESVYSKWFLSKHDLMFSGHTCCFVFFGHVIQGVLGHGIVKFLFPLTLIAARQHYTIDVVVAMLVYHSV